MIIAGSVRLYGKINSKEDSDATTAEFNLALDSNVLPIRYNQDIINQMFKLVSEHTKTAQGMDMISFVYYDFVLRIFDLPNTAARRWTINSNEFYATFQHYLFPAGVRNEVTHIQNNNLTAAAYNMYTYMNITSYTQEGDHFLKFTQTGEHALAETGNSIQATTGNLSAFNMNTTSVTLFNILDNGQGYLTYFDYGNFFQIAAIFSRLDVYNRGRLVAGELHEKLTTYSDFPAISANTRDRARRFNLLPVDLYVDLQRAILVLRIDDYVASVGRKGDPTTLYEVELKNVFSKVGLGAVPDAYMNLCLRGVDDNNVPKYDWECAFVKALTSTLNYLESSQSYITATKGNLTLSNTIFVNIDPAIK